MIIGALWYCFHILLPTHGYTVLVPNLNNLFYFVPLVLLTLVLLTIVFACISVGPRLEESTSMLQTIGFESFDELVTSTVPADIMADKPLSLEDPMSETEALAQIRKFADRNKVMKSYIGQGYYDTQVPAVILRNMLENPGWYTAYTPYQAEISQGRLEMLLNFQTLVVDLTGLPMAVASLLDESSAAAEAMQMCFALKGGKGKNKKTFFSDTFLSQKY